MGAIAPAPLAGVMVRSWMGLAAMGDVLVGTISPDSLFGGKIGLEGIWAGIRYWPYPVTAAMSISFRNASLRVVLKHSNPARLCRPSAPTNSVVSSCLDARFVRALPRWI